MSLSYEGRKTLSRILMGQMNLLCVRLGFCHKEGWFERNRPIICSWTLTLVLLKIDLKISLDMRYHLRKVKLLA